MREIGQGKLTDEERATILDFASKVSKNDFNHDIQLAPAWVRTILMSR